MRNTIASGNETINGFPSSANMLMLEWDNELAAIAQSHASQCDFEHDCYQCRRTGTQFTCLNLLGFICDWYVFFR